MGLCETCRFWNEAERDWEAQRAGFRLCDAIRPGWHITGNEGLQYPTRTPDEPFTLDIPADRQALLDAWAQRDIEATQKEKAYVMDGSEYRAELWTGPDFGCVKHEPRDK